jgi:periplasmic copper chaperone A
MNTAKTISAALALAAGALASSSLAHGYKAGNLSIRHPWARETAVGQKAGGGFLVIANSGKREDRLVAGETPVAAEVQLHTMTMDGGIMRMRQVTGGIAIPARGTLELKPGSFHIMFIGLKRPLQAGERVPVTLRFQRAGKVRVEFAVEKAGAMGPMPMGGMEHDHAGH